MASKKSMPPSRSQSTAQGAATKPVTVSLVQSLPKSVTIARVLLLIAFGLTVYLATASLSQGGIAGCGPEGGCGEVLHSRWAYWLGVPVSIPAGLLYLMLFGLTFPVARSAGAPGAKGPRLALQTGCIAVVGAAIWFVGLQAFAIGKFCPFCCTTHAVASVAALLLLNWVHRMEGADLVSAIAGASVALGVVVGGQYAVEPKAFKVAGSGSTVTTSGNSEAKQTPLVEPPPTLKLTLHTNQFEFDLTEFPLIGSPKATHVMLSLFDYTCKYCRTTHHPIVEAQSAFSNQLAVLSLPMPLASDCNRYVRQTSSAHSNACQFASLGLAVWRADKTKFRQFDEWLMRTLPKSSLEQARLEAVALVGTEKLDRALADPWIQKTIQLAIDVYGANSRATRSGNMPQTVIGTNIVTGTIKTTKDLFELLDRNFGLKQP